MSAAEVGVEGEREYISTAGTTVTNKKGEKKIEKRSKLEGRR
jgi:hypothetical protein